MAGSWSGAGDARASSVATLTAVTLVVFAAGVECAVACALWLGGRASATALLGGVAAVAAVAMLASRAGSSRRTTAAALASAVAIIVLAVPVAKSTFDVSWDGQAYHELAMLHLARGWNPFRGLLPAELLSTTFFVNHYAKGAWLRGAVAYLATGDLEASKAWTMILAGAAGFSFAGAARAAGLGRGWAIGSGVLAAANPVASAQLLTNYVDGQLASVLTVCAGCAVAALAGGGVGPVLGLAACCVLLPGLKFTGLVYAVVLAGFVVVAGWRIHRVRALMLAGAAIAGLAAGTIYVGWNPYVTNWRERGHPFYPLAGPGAVDIVTGQAASSFLARSQLGRLALSVSSYSSNDRETPPRPKWPFTVGEGETVIFSWPDVRIGGFGPLFSGGSLLALLATAIAARRRPRAAPLLGIAAAAMVLGSVLLNPHAWWARYAPQLWLVPLAISIGAAASRRRAPAAIACAALVTLAVDAGIVGVNAVHRGRRRSAALSAQLTALAASRALVPVRFGMFEAHRHRLRVAGVRFVESNPLPCAAPALLESSDTAFCPPSEER